MVLDVLAAVFVLAIVYVLVRPRSKGGELVNAAGAVLTALVTNATDIAAA